MRLLSYGTLSFAADYGPPIVMRQSFSPLRSASQVHSLTWLLAVTLLAQGLIPLQAHSRFAKDDQGQTILICTLAGTQTISLDTWLGRDVAHDESTLDQGLNPAMLFSQLMADNTPVLGALTVQPYFLPAITTVELPQAALPRVPFRSPRNRGPPRA